MRNMRNSIIAVFGIAGLLAVATLLPAVPDHRLIGFGCGDGRLTLIAMEEDEFPPCEEIVTVTEACPDGESASDCAAYWGHGY